MSEKERQARLLADLEVMKALQQASTILDFESTGDPPDRYTITFRGKGIARDSGTAAGIQHVSSHRCELRLPYSYPKRPPDIRWLTPTFHPNVSFSGFINLRDIGLPWEPGLGLDAICERLWDIARLAYVNLEKATNYSAKNWFEEDCELQLPVDQRPLRDTAGPSPSNIVRYERRGDQGNTTTPAASEPADVFFIGEETPPPAMPRRRPAPRPPGPEDNDDDVFYIGD